jgi:hypothetical protein
LPNEEWIESVFEGIPGVKEFHKERREEARRASARWGDAGELYVFASQIPIEPTSDVDPSRFLQIVFRSIAAHDPQMREVVNELAAINERIDEVRALIEDRPTIRHTTITSLGQDKLELAAPIPVVIEEYEDECLARWIEAQATGRGVSEPEALASLRDDIAYLFRDLESTTEEEMTPDWKLVRDVLRNFIKG